MNTPSCRPNRAVMGFSLTEVMIALSIGIVVLLVALQIYESSQKGSKTLAAQTLLASQARSAAALLNNQLSKTPNWGCWSEDNDSTTLSDGLIIHTRVDGAPLSPLLGSSDVPGTPDSLIFNGASTEAETLLAVDSDFASDSEIIVESLSALELDGESLGAGDIITIHNCVRSDVVGVASVDANTRAIEVDCDGCLPRDYAAGATVSRVERLKIFIHDNNLCLARNLLQAECGPAEVLLGDVVDLQARYGLDSDLDSDVDRYALGKHLAIDEWKKIQTVELRLLLRSAEEKVFDAPQTYFYLGGSVLANDRRSYKPVSVTANLRNYKPY